MTFIVELKTDNAEIDVEKTIFYQFKTIKYKIDSKDFLVL